MDTNDHKQSQPSQQKPATSQQSLTCWTFARPVPRHAVTVIYRNQQSKKQKRFYVLRKKRAKPKITTTFGKSVFRLSIYMLPNTKDLAINQTMVAYGNRQNATAFARANNSDLLRSLKHLMETRLYYLIVSLTTILSYLYISLIYLPMTKLQYLSHVSRAWLWLKQRWELSIPEGHLNLEVPLVPSLRSTHSTLSPQWVNEQSDCRMLMFLSENFVFQMLTCARLPVIMELTNEKL